MLTRMLTRAWGGVARARRDRGGNVATLFALCAVPLIAVVGIGIDYGYMLSLKAKLDQAADAAAVAGATTAQSYLTSYTGASDVTLLAQAAGQAQASAQFSANLGWLPSGTLSAITPVVTRNQQTITSTVNYSFSTKPFLMNIVGERTMTVSGNTKSTVVMPTYINIYVVIDNSESMGIGATAADQQKVYNATGNCALACHYSTNNTEPAAHNAGATLRIDVAKQAVVAGLKSIPSGGNYQVAVYTLSNALEKVSDLSNNISSAISAVNGIDLEADANSGGTNTTYALQTLATQLSTAGSGLTSNTAQGIVMLITDAVQDSDMKVKTPSGFADTNDPNFVKFSPCNQSSCWTDPDFNLTFEAFDPAQCQSIKDKKYTMMTLDVQYLIPPSNMQSSTAFARVFDYVSQYLAPSTAANMKTCASNGFAYSANTPADIAAATSAMFNAIPIAAVARLTQ